MPTEKDYDLKIAVRCTNCKKILAFKLGSASGCLQLKCPACKTQINVDLSLRRGKIYNRNSNIPLTVTFL
jgi:phage FluMu protein Com